MKISGAESPCEATPEQPTLVLNKVDQHVVTQRLGGSDERPAAIEFGEFFDEMSKIRGGIEHKCVDADVVASALIQGEALSSRELEVLAMVAEGLGNKDIAARLKISEHTVKFHVSSILGKLRATTRGEAVARGVREGLVVI